MEKKIQTLGDLEAEAERFIKALALRPSEVLHEGGPLKRGATLVILKGELGAGKTAFVKAVARVLGVEEVVTSPTFVLEKIYQLPKYGVSAFKRLVHIDAYRLEKGADLAPLGFDELLQDAGNLILLEWPEKVADALPPPAARISLAVNPDGSRILSYD